VGIPDEAFNAIEGDDKRIAASHKARNKAARGGQLDLLAAEAPADYGSGLAEELARIDAMPDETPGQLGEKERLFREFLDSAERSAASLVADAYCAAFVWPAAPDGPQPITQGILEGLREGAESLRAESEETVNQLAADYEWFHWHIQFPDVFCAGSDIGCAAPTGWEGGFDCILGNPPWERIKLQEKEFFAARSPEIANAANAAKRKQIIARLTVEHPALALEFEAARRRAEGESHIVRTSNRYPLCGRGDINTYSVFAELNRQLIAAGGRVGCIVPLGIATDHTTQYFFQDIIAKRALVSLRGFENEARIFPAVHNEAKFSLLTMAGSAGVPEPPSFSFFIRHVEQLADPERRFELTPEDIMLINPNTRTCPIFRTRRDAEITKGIYRRVPVLVDEAKDPSGDPWQMRFMRMFDMANDSGLFRSSEELQAEGFELDGNVFIARTTRYTPLYEAKMIHQFDHRYGTYRGQTEAQANKGVLPQVDEREHKDPRSSPIPRYWVDQAEVEARLTGTWERDWFIGWRDITNSVARRTLVSAAIPGFAVGARFGLAMPGVEPVYTAALLSSLNSFVADYVARQKIGGSAMTYFILRQIALPSPVTYDGPVWWSRDDTFLAWLCSRVLELVYTSRDMAAFAHDLGYEGSPFLWDEERRFELRCQLDAAFFHLYGIERGDVDYIMDSFWIVRADDEKRFGEYRTKRRILELFDEYEKAQTR